MRSHTNDVHTQSIGYSMEISLTYYNSECVFSRHLRAHHFSFSMLFSLFVFAPLSQSRRRFHNEYVVRTLCLLQNNKFNFQPSKKGEMCARRNEEKRSIKKRKHLNNTEGIILFAQRSIFTLCVVFE